MAVCPNFILICATVEIAPSSWISYFYCATEGNCFFPYSQKHVERRGDKAKLRREKEAWQGALEEEAYAK